MNARQSRAKYSLKQLLDADFRLTAHGSENPLGAAAGLKEMAVAFPDAVGRWKQVNPAEKAQ